MSQDETDNADKTPHMSPAATTGKPPRNLVEWVEMLSEKGMPVFAKTVQELSGVATDRESSAAELSRVILQDAAMTARLLRVAEFKRRQAAPSPGRSPRSC